MTTQLMVPEPRSDKLVLTVEEAAKLIGVSRCFAYELIRRGELPHLKFGRRLVVPRRPLLAMLGEVTQTEEP